MTQAPWRSLIEGMLEGIWLLDPVSLRVVGCNTAGARLVGLQEADMVGRAVVEFAATPEDVYFWEEMAQGLAQTLSSESLVRHSDGTPVQVQRRVSMVQPGGGQTLVLVALVDLTQRRAMQTELERRLAELRATLESTADGVLVTDLQGKVRSFNHRFASLWTLPEEMTRQRDDAAMRTHMADAVLDAAGYLARLDELTRAPLLEGEDVLQFRSGQVLERVTRPQLSRGQAIGRVFSFRDVTEQRISQARLQLASKVFESSLDAIFITGADGRMITVNPRFESMTRSVFEHWQKRVALDFFFSPDDAVLRQRIEHALLHQGTWEGEVHCRCGDGSSFPAQLSWVALRDEAGHSVNSIGIFRDLTDQLAAHKRIEELAYSDALTGVPNRSAMVQRVAVALSLAERRGGSFAVALIDLDRFKNINESLGHLGGDAVLREVSQRLSLCLRQEDFMCRLGADEFAVLLSGADVRGAESTVRRMLHRLAQPFGVSGQDFSVGCSIGIAMYPGDGRTLDELLTSADSAMRRVKDQGRGSFRFHQPQINVDLLSRMKLEHAMRQAQEAGQFRLHYQPKVDVATGRITGAEALLRWRDANLGDISPAVFIPLAEETGLIVALGAWVLDEAVRQAARWRQVSGQPLSVAVNVSALQFQQPDFVQRVASALQREGLPAHLLEVELTESILVDGVDEALQRLDALAQLGVGLAIDDFGVGYSSLAYLKRFPIDTLKIDRSFVMGLPGAQSDRAIVNAIVDLGHALQLKVVAEGVETAAQLALMQEMGCDHYQGFLFSAGLPAPEFDKLLRLQPDVGL